jgi:hypothetical protein
MIPRLACATARPNKRMKLTRLVAARGRQDKVPPRAPAGRTWRTASQLMRGVSPQSNCLATIRFSSGFARQRLSTASDPLYLRMKYVDASGIGHGDLTRRASVLAHWSRDF